MVDFEGKKDAVQVFNNLLRRQIGTRTPTVEYICTKVNFFIILGSSDLIMWFKLAPNNKSTDNTTQVMLIPHFNVYSQRQYLHCVVDMNTKKLL